MFGFCRSTDQVIPVPGHARKVCPSQSHILCVSSSFLDRTGVRTCACSLESLMVQSNELIAVGDRIYVVYPGIIHDRWQRAARRNGYDILCKVPD